jgi:hypothetical protein
MMNASFSGGFQVVASQTQNRPKEGMLTNIPSLSTTFKHGFLHHLQRHMQHAMQQSSVSRSIRANLEKQSPTQKEAQTPRLTTERVTDERATERINQNSKDLTPKERPLFEKTRQTASEVSTEKDETQSNSSKSPSTEDTPIQEDNSLPQETTQTLTLTPEDYTQLLQVFASLPTIPTQDISTTPPSSSSTEEHAFVLPSSSLRVPESNTRNPSRTDVSNTAVHGDGESPQPHTLETTTHTSTATTQETPTAQSTPTLSEGTESLKALLSPYLLEKNIPTTWLDTLSLSLEVEVPHEDDTVFNTLPFQEGLLGETHPSMTSTPQVSNPISLKESLTLEPSLQDKEPEKTVNETLPALPTPIDSFTETLQPSNLPTLLPLSESTPSLPKHLPTETSQTPSNQGTLPSPLVETFTDKPSTLKTLRLVIEPQAQGDDASSNRLKGSMVLILKQPSSHVDPLVSPHTLEGQTFTHSFSTENALSFPSPRTTSHLSSTLLVNDLSNFQSLHQAFKAGLLPDGGSPIGQTRPLTVAYTPELPPSTDLSLAEALKKEAFEMPHLPKNNPSQNPSSPFSWQGTLPQETSAYPAKLYESFGQLASHTAHPFLTMEHFALEERRQQVDLEKHNATLNALTPHTETTQQGLSDSAFSGFSQQDASTESQAHPSHTSETATPFTLADNGSQGFSESYAQQGHQQEGTYSETPTWIPTHTPPLEETDTVEDPWVLPQDIPPTLAPIAEYGNLWSMLNHTAPTDPFSLTQSDFATNTLSLYESASFKLPHLKEYHPASLDIKSFDSVELMLKGVFPNTSALAFSFHPTR